MTRSGVPEDAAGLLNWLSRRRRLGRRRGGAPEPRDGPRRQRPLARPSATPHRRRRHGRRRPALAVARGELCPVTTRSKIVTACSRPAADDDPDDNTCAQTVRRRQRGTRTARINMVFYSKTKLKERPRARAAAAERRPAYHMGICRTSLDWSSSSRSLAANVRNCAWRPAICSALRSRMDPRRATYVSMS